MVVQVAGARFYTRHSAIAWADWGRFAQFSDDFAEFAAGWEARSKAHPPLLFCHDNRTGSMHPAF